MNKVTQSILVASMMAASGFALAQSPMAPAAEGKAQMGKTDRNPVTGNSPAIPGLAGAPTQGGASGTTRAEVKTEAANAAPLKRDTGDTMASPGMKGSATQGGTSGPTRAEVKAEAVNATPPKRETGDTMASKPTSSASEKKQMRDEKRAKAKAKRDEAKMNAGSSMKPETVKN